MIKNNSNSKNRKQNERSSFSINVSDEQPPTKGKGQHIYEENVHEKKRQDIVWSSCP